MAKKKTTRKAAKKPPTEKSPAKKPAKPATTKKKPAPSRRAAKPVSKPAAKKVARKKPAQGTAKPASAKSTGTAPPKAAAKSSSRGKSRASAKSKLGRPRIPGDAKIDSVFRKEFDARQLCEFLGVDTVRELEKFAPEEIIQKMMAPVVQTVGKIRKILAVANRSLATDEEFAIEFRDLYAPPDEA